MRTTLDIEDDVLQAAKELARARGSTAGAILSELARQALDARGRDAPSHAAGTAGEEFLGFRPFAARGGVVTNDLVNRLRDQDID